MEIVENDTDYVDAGTIVDINGKQISVLCADNKVIKMSVSLYKKCDRIFTYNYIKREMRIGQRIC